VADDTSTAPIRPRQWPSIRHVAQSLLHIEAMKQALAALAMAIALPLSAYAQAYLFVDPHTKAYQVVRIHRQVCDPSYPTVCIPPGPPDLDCNQIHLSNFPVVNGDPHRFDRDHDGKRCGR
jgi:hypothetical protein